jgi:hypothetical protein
MSETEAVNTTLQDEMSTDNPFTEPAAEVIKAITTLHVESNSVATRQNLTDIDKAMLNGPLKGVTTNERSRIYMLLAVNCANQGSSAKVNLVGTTGKTATTHDIHLTDLAQVVRTVCTLRQFCMAYAKLVWNYFTMHGIAPANYVRFGFSEETKYAGFDFFDGVTNDAAIAPRNKTLFRQPTRAEMIVSEASKQVRVHRDLQRQANVSTGLVELTAGRSHETSKPLLLAGPPSY